MIVNDYIAECADGKTRPLEDPLSLERIIFHRISRAADETSPFGPIPDDKLTGPRVAAWFRETGEHQAGSYTGGQCPYHLLVRTNGEIDQMQRLSDTSPHARRWSYGAVGEAFAGDFRKHKPTSAQITVAHCICFWGLRSRLNVHTHDFFRAKSGLSKKGCPGDMFDFYGIYGDSLRRSDNLDLSGSIMTRREAFERLAEMGLTF